MLRFNKGLYGYNMNMISMKRFFTVCCFVVLFIPMVGCASARDQSLVYKSPTEISDPLESVNRAIFGFNNVFDMVVFEPTAKAYRFLLPSPVRDSVQNFMRNLRTPLIFANNVLQGDFGGAGVSAGRFAMNTTVGIAGIFDVAATQGLKYEPEDFGQTLGKWGFGHGFYVVLPILGPSSLRDGVGMAGDALADPVRIFAYSDANREWVYYARNGLEAVDSRSRLIGTIEDLRRNSVDYYAAIRSVYGQKRYSLVQDDPYGHMREDDEVQDDYDY